MFKDNKVALIVARDLEHNIGLNNDLPWRCKADLKHFRDMTKGKVCIMGRKTFESLPKPLDKRQVIVVSSNPSTELVDQIFDLDNHTLANSVETALGIANALNTNRENEIMICGGASIYKLFASFVDQAYVSVINTVTVAKEGETLTKFGMGFPSFVEVKYKFFNLE